MKKITCSTEGHTIERLQRKTVQSLLNELLHPKALNNKHMLQSINLKTYIIIVNFYLLLSFYCFNPFVSI